MYESISVLKGDITDDLLHAYRKAGRVACDIETSGLDWQSSRIGTFQLFAHGTDPTIVQLNGEIPHRLRELIHDEAVQKIFHHAPFDMRFLTWHWKTPLRNIACTKVASKLLYPDAPTEEHTLRALLQRHLDISISKADERVSNWLATDLSAGQVTYAAIDVVHLLKLFDILKIELKKRGLESLYGRCLQHLPTRVELDILGYGDIYLY